jgi:hypothetical protein
MGKGNKGKGKGGKASAKSDDPQELKVSFIFISNFIILLPRQIKATFSSLY